MQICLYCDHKNEMCPTVLGQRLRLYKSQNRVFCPLTFSVSYKQTVVNVLNRIFCTLLDKPEFSKCHWKMILYHASMEPVFSHSVFISFISFSLSLFCHRVLLHILTLIAYWVLVIKPCWLKKETEGKLNCDFLKNLFSGREKLLIRSWIFFLASLVLAT